MASAELQPARTSADPAYGSHDLVFNTSLSDAAATLAGEPRLRRDANTEGQQDSQRAAEAVLRRPIILAQVLKGRSIGKHTPDCTHTQTAYMQLQ